MPNRCKPPSERREKGLMLSLRQSEYDIIQALSQHLGVSKVDLILSAIKQQYSKSEIKKDYTNHYIALLKSQIDDYEERIGKEQETLRELKEEYEIMMDIRRRMDDEDSKDIQSERKND